MLKNTLGNCDCKTFYCTGPVEREMKIIGFASSFILLSILKAFGQCCKQLTTVNYNCSEVKKTCFAKKRCIGVISVAYFFYSCK